MFWVSKLVPKSFFWHSQARGAACLNPTPPPPPAPDPPKFLNPSFSNMRFRGKMLAPKKIGLLKGYFCFIQCVYTQNIQSLVENSKMGEKHKKKLTPDLISGSDLG